MTEPRVTLIVLRAQDVERTLAFYRALGLTFAQEKHGSGAVHYSSTLGETVIEIYPGKPGPEPDRRAPGATMIGFAVVSLDGVLAAVRALGSTVVTKPKQGDSRRAVVEDPDGRAVEITEAEPSGRSGSAGKSYSATIDDIMRLPHELTFACAKCGTTLIARALDIYTVCPSCKQQHKTRAAGGIGTEVHDVIDAVLEWMGSGTVLEAVMDRKHMIDEDRVQSE